MSRLSLAFFQWHMPLQACPISSPQLLQTVQGLRQASVCPASQQLRLQMHLRVYPYLE